MNYYAVSKPCPTCGKSEVIDEHIGKSSYGWRFLFHALPSINSWREWKEYLKDKIIVNEEREEISIDDFELMIKAKKSHPSCLCHALDEDGYAFCKEEFS